MSGHSDLTPCPNCGAAADQYTDRKPFDYTSITCYECGFMMGPHITYMTLKELNEERKEREVGEPLVELPKQLSADEIF